MFNGKNRKLMTGAAIAALLFLTVPAISVTNAPSATPDLPPATAATDLKVGADAVESHQYDLATIRLTRAIDSGVLTDEALALAYHHRGIARQKMGFEELAIADYSKAISIGTLTTEVLARVYYNRGLAKGNSGDTLGAELDYSHAIENAPKYAAAYHNRANLERERQDFATAIRDYSIAVKNLEGKNRKLPLMGRAISFQKTGNIVSATNDLDQILQIDPEYKPAIQMRRQLASSLQKTQFTSNDTLITGAISKSKSKLSVAPHHGEVITHSTRDGWTSKTVKYPDAISPETIARIQKENNSLETASLRAIDMVPAPGSQNFQNQSVSSAQPLPQPMRVAAAAPTMNVSQSRELGGFKIQLGAFREPELASQAWHQISRNNANLVKSMSHMIEEADLGAKGTYFRLQAGSFESAEIAKSRCADFHARNLDCIVVTR
tara:strand:- start:86691 stop:88001 length:1311 start_codon:yes stop_codon:yes gene_type:complete